MNPILPVYLILVDQLEICLMYKSGSIESVIASLGPELVLGDSL
jgi:hypothetical protein